MFFLSKLLPSFVLPLFFSLILLLLGLARQRRRLMWAGVFVLIVSSNPLVGHYLIRSAEGWTERRSVTDIPVVDAVVVLSAGRAAAPGPGHVSEWKDANRFFGGVELWLAGKAPLLMFTGASIASRPDLPSEGEVLKEHARALGVPPDRIVVTPIVLTTADEAREIAGILRARQAPHPRVALVTSAFHMGRARQIFGQAGLAVEPFPVSFWSSDSQTMTVFSFVPSVSALNETHTALRELYGRAFYWLKGALAAR